MLKTDTRTPIERMIDKSCKPVCRGRTMLLRCPSCKRTKETFRDKSDPVNAVEMIVKCPECWTDGSFEDPTYLDKDGKELKTP